MTALALQIPTALEFNNQPKIQSKGQRQSASSTTTTTVIGVERLDDVPIYVGRCYAVTAQFHYKSTVAGDWLQISARYSTDGSTPTTSSTVIPGGLRGVTAAQVSLPEAGYLRTTYEPTSDQLLSVLLCVVRAGGTGTVSLYADANTELQMTIEDIGEAVGDTGTDI